jgi:starch synthase (maltosyl-transferring)
MIEVLRLDIENPERVIIEKVIPEIDNGRYPIKRVPGQKVNVEAHIISDGHDEETAYLCYKHEKDAGWKEKELVLMYNDEWRADFTVDAQGTYLYTIKAWIDPFRTWQRDLEKKTGAKQDVKIDLLIGASIIEEAIQRAAPADRLLMQDFANRMIKGGAGAGESALDPAILGLMKKYPDTEQIAAYNKELKVLVDREKAGFSAWYEIFPRSCSPVPGKHGTFKDCEAQLPEIAAMGFDVVYFPPIHPIGLSMRKGKNNSLTATEKDPGSPWAIGSKEGGHKSIHPALGTFADFERLRKRAESLGMEIALDIAFQCSVDHPYIKEHPEWFCWRPDNTIQYAENPPKKYEDIVQFDFKTKDWKGLWEELKSIVIFWAEKGVRIFRVDNPHTKPFAFWEWMILEVKKVYPDALFLAEAFTRPKIMYRLAKVGFSGSYTYFTWRNGKNEITEYINELTRTEVSEYFRPNFWPNTPDILHEFLQKGGRPAFVLRLVLAATLSPNYGIYGGPYLLCRNEPFPGKEEYINNEKYELKRWDINSPGSLKTEATRINKIRKENNALQAAGNIVMCNTDNGDIIAYTRYTGDKKNVIIVVVNLDPYHTQSGWVDMPAEAAGINPDQEFKAQDLFGGGEYTWNGRRNFVKLDPNVTPAHIIRIMR